MSSTGVSTATETISTQLSQSVNGTMSIPIWLGMALMFIGTLVIILSMSSSLTSIFAPLYQPKVVELDYEHPEYKYKYIEDFNNIPGSFVTVPTLKYQSASLLPPNYSNEELLGQNLIFGEAKRYVSPDPFLSRIDVFANLYVINGNVFSSEEEYKKSIASPSSYQVYLGDASNNQTKLHLGELKKDGDGIYKLQFRSNTLADQSHDHKTMFVTYKSDSDKPEKVVLMGDFH